MKIIDGSVIKVALPARRAHQSATLTTPIGRGYGIVRLVTDNGIVGYGEATVLPQWGGDFGRYFGETGGTTKHVVVDCLMPVLEGEDPMRIEWIHSKMDSTIKGYPYAKAAIDMALYDIVGKATDLPAYALLGGLWRDRVPLTHSLGIMESDKAVEEGLAAVSEGIKNLKVKAGLDPIRDVDLVKRLRDAVGPNVTIGLDANQRYESVKDAIKTIKAMEPYDILYMEQPVEGLGQMARIASAVDTPIMADESVWSPADALAAIAVGGADCFSIYTTKPGGLFPARQVASIALAAGIRCNVNGSIETGIGNAANLHLIACSKIINLPNVIPITNIAGKEQTEIVGKYYLDDIIREPFEYDDGYLRVPSGPGLGIEVDEEKLEKYTLEE